MHTHIYTNTVYVYIIYNCIVCIYIYKRNQKAYMQGGVKESKLSVQTGIQNPKGHKDKIQNPITTARTRFKSTVGTERLQ